MTSRVVTKDEFKEYFFRLGGGDRAGYGLSYWNNCFEGTDPAATKYEVEEPATPEHNRMFIISGKDDHRLCFLTEESEESFFEFPES